MKLSISNSLAINLLITKCFSFTVYQSRKTFSTSTTASQNKFGYNTNPLFSMIDEEQETKDGTKSKVKIEEPASTSENTPSEDGLPWWWELVFQLPIMERGEPGKDVIFGDTAHVLRTNIEQIFGGYPSLDGCPLAEGAIDDIADGTMFIGLQRYYENYKSPYKLCFGPK